MTETNAVVNKVKRRYVAVGVIFAAALFSFVCVLAVCNIFLPVRYLAAYLNIGSDKPASGSMRVRFLSLYDGDCTLVEFPDGKTMLVDGGKGDYASNLKIFKTLKKSGIDKLNYIASIGNGGNRIGGLGEVVKYFGADKAFVLRYSESESSEFSGFFGEAKARGVEVASVNYGDGFYGDDYACTFLRADFSVGASVGIPSAAIYIKCYDTALLLLGDCSTYELSDFYYKHEEGRGPELRGVEIVKAAKGCTETFTPLIDILSPETSIISGSNPTAAAWADLQLHSGDKTYRLDYSGTVTVNINSVGYDVIKERT